MAHDKSCHGAWLTLVVLSYDRSTGLHGCDLVFLEEMLSVPWGTLTQQCFVTTLERGGRAGPFCIWEPRRFSCMGTC